MSSLVSRFWSEDITDGSGQSIARGELGYSAILS
jgi:hypothetical protein